MPDEGKWYFAKGGTAYGPLSLQALCGQYATGAFTTTDFVYCKGQTDGWVKASSIPGLCDSLDLEPEPEPEHHQVPLYEKASFQQSAGDGGGKKSKEGGDKSFWGRLRGKKK